MTIYDTLRHNGVPIRKKSWEIKRGISQNKYIWTLWFCRTTFHDQMVTISLNLVHVLGEKWQPRRMILWIFYGWLLCQCWLLASEAESARRNPEIETNNTPTDPLAIGLITVSDAILAGRQDGWKSESICMKIRCQISLVINTLVSKKLWIENFIVTREKLNAKIWGT